MNGLASKDKNPDLDQHKTLDSFLASVEKQAYVIALSACRDQQAALDIVQDSMLKMVQSYRNKPPQEWRPLFFKVLNNRVADHHRKRGFSKLTQWFGARGNEGDNEPDVLDQLPSPQLNPESMTDATMLNNQLATAMETLSEKQRQVLLLRLWTGLSVKETAVAMSISEGSVKTHLSRAVTEMRKLLKDFQSP